jgi:ABC-type oligopeptide transport system ATPase subunit
LLFPAERRELVKTALHEVGLAPADMDKYPHEFSGGQRQRISIARALITRPKLIVADEPVSALDVSIRAQVLDLFADLNHRLGVAYLFITHDLTVARAITDEVLVMHEGKIVERGVTGSVLDNPQSEAAKALVAAAPDLHRAIARRLREGRYPPTRRRAAMQRLPRAFRNGSRIFVLRFASNKFRDDSPRDAFANHQDWRSATMRMKPVIPVAVRSGA